MNEWFQIKEVDTIDSPALIVYKQRVEENIRLLLAMIDDPFRLRPHVKTHKLKEVSLMLIEAGIRKFKCATIAEAEMLAMALAPDVLLAYQPVGPKLQRFISLIKKYPRTTFSCLIDHYTSAADIAEAAAGIGSPIPVFIDVNAGMNRSGISPGLTLKLYDDCKALTGVHIEGLHVYDGHLRNPNFEEREQACNEAFAAIEALNKQLMDEGAETIIIAGGSPTFPIHAKRKQVECSPGTFIFWDKGYQNLCKEQPFIPAALVISRVVSQPGANTLCLDLGHKSIASEGELSKRIFFLNAPDLQFVGHSEEHLIAEAPAGHPYKTGDVLYGLPFHICPTVALYERAVVIENGKAVAEWKIIARDRKITV